jgi:hypothetical protein
VLICEIYEEGMKKSNRKIKMCIFWKSAADLLERGRLNLENG